MLPLSFGEFLDFHNFEARKLQTSLGEIRRQIFDENGERHDLREAFNAYMRYGGMPGITEVGFDQERVLALLDGIYSTSMISEVVRNRELSPLRKIRDNYEKIVLSLEPGLDSSYDGIKSVNLIEWLLDA